MKKLYGTDDRILAGQIQSVLEDHGIRCLLKNQSLAGAIGELPPLECWPELWIIDDEDFDRARELFDAFFTPMARSEPDWQCTCGETIEGQFLSCWNCGGSKPLDLG